ncbi:MAG: putative transposase [Syntrophorhabdus sp. PtaU1.Bin002]|nr:MAG: putative transposase [Syntrophorhabdus sp. PtaB.Bin006]OPY73904.1 MAG: putative transposase [Syntrophorhabdus sp. PtaU1.Bin002]
MTLDAGEFIRRFLLHILPDGFVRIRYFGILSNRSRKACLARCRILLGVKEVPESAPEPWQALLLRLTGIDVLHCPRCNGVMRVRLLSSRGSP